ncbi:MAG: hypothetical protein ACXVDI_24935 [Ktedonobacterales bacterium]
MNRNRHGDTAQVECPEGITTSSTPQSAAANPEIRVADYVLAQARLILGIVSDADAQQLLAAEQQLQRLFETLAKEDEDS